MSFKIQSGFAIRRAVLGITVERGWFGEIVLEIGFGIFKFQIVFPHKMRFD